MINICIPSLNRPELLKETTLKLLVNLPDDFKIYIFLSESDSRYEGLGTIVVTNIKGRGKTRTFIRNYFSVGEKIIMLDDDLKDICSTDRYFDLFTFFRSMFVTMEKENVKFAGCTPHSNEFYMKEDYSTNLKYSGGHLIAEIIREKPIIVNINHYEDYVANILYWVRDKKLLRFNNIYVKTKYYNPEGGIVETYGSLEKRKEAADHLATELEELFTKDICSKYKKKKYAVFNLRLKSQRKWRGDFIHLEAKFNQKYSE